ncbi:hypothetical_protein [Leishmania braziliensis MHOM/BR/75/M2904]|nr:hypothetical_protein [Leishmania braziliensis MHOM/BR/75/M2904]
MDRWFEYALGLSELIYSMKLQEYEDACASLLLTAATTTAATLVAEAGEANKARRSNEKFHHHRSGVEAAVAPTAARAAHVQSPAPMGSSAGSPLVSVDGTVLNAFTPSFVAAVSVSSDVPVVTPDNRAVTDPGTESSATSVLNAACLAETCGIDQSTTSLSSLSPIHVPPPTVGWDRRAPNPTSGAVGSPAEIIEALVDAMLLRKSMRTATSRSQQIDDIQAEADFVFQELEDVFALQPGDAAAAAAACTGADVVRQPSPTLSSSTTTHFQFSGNEEECDVASEKPRALPSPLPASGAGERHLLYGELTSVGVRQLQAISMASTCVMREEHRRSPDYGTGDADFPAHPSTSMTSSLGSFSTPAFNSAPPVPRSVSAPSLHTRHHCHSHSHASRGAVVVAVDVGCGNGRLLFEWSRLAAAACRRRHTSSPRQHVDEVGTFVGAAPASFTRNSTTSTLGSTTETTTDAATKHRSNLLAAVYAPLGIENPAAVWRGWLGVGIELVPSRMRIARKALVPHYLNLKQALPIPSAGDGVAAPVTHLEPCLPEAIADADSSASYGASTSLQLGIVSHTTVVRSSIGSPASTGISVAKLPSCRAPQPSARVLLYDGDALAPGVLSNATMCQFPNFGGHSEPLLLHRSCVGHGGSGEHDGCAGGSTIPCTTTSTNTISATVAEMNKAHFLNNTRSGVHRRRGARKPASMELASITDASDDCIARGSTVKQGYYPLCHVEGEPPLTGREDPHLVVFCCGLGFDEAQVRRLCQRLEDMLLYPSSTAPVTTPSSVGEDSMMDPQPGMKVTGFPLYRTCQHHHHMAHGGDAEAAASLANCASSSLPSPEERSEEDMKTQYGMRPLTLTPADPGIDIATGIGAGFASHRRWESVTCVLLLRPMDVLLPTFPLFRYARRVFDTLHQPISAEDTALLLSTGSRADGSPVPFSMRATPVSECLPGSSNVCDMVESDLWSTTLETTWMSAAPAWVVRFHF